MSTKRIRREHIKEWIRWNIPRKSDIVDDSHNILQAWHEDTHQCPRLDSSRLQQHSQKETIRKASKASLSNPSLQNYMIQQYMQAASCDWWISNLKSTSSDECTTTTTTKPQSQTRCCQYKSSLLHLSPMKVCNCENWL